MATVSLPLPINALHDEPQTLEFEKIATFIGGNGSGKSSILKSIFEGKLDDSQYQDYKVVCFSSGQNESYSERFSKHLNSERLSKKALNLDCFYYDKSWSKLLIFLASTSNAEGLVRTFLRQNDYVIESELDEDNSTKLSIDVRVAQGYIKIVRDALQDETEGEQAVITNNAYHRTLQNFINSLISKNYNFEQPLEKTKVELNQDAISKVSFEIDNNVTFDSKVTFFTQAADNDYFIVKDSLDLTFLKVIDGRNNKTLRLEELSDGEYQLLFLYALIDLFDKPNTLFLFDEADSHLHYKNIEKLWNVYDEIQGSIITTTHLLDSIVKAGQKNLRIIENGEVEPKTSSFKLIQRLETLSEVEAVQHKILSMYKYLIVMDNAHDWEIFKLLIKRKLYVDNDSERLIDEKLSNFICISIPSGFPDGHDRNMFGLDKINWYKNYSNVLRNFQSKIEKVFLICDRDEFPISFIGKVGCNFTIKGHDFKPHKSLPKAELLSWRRREIKHYLLSFTALNGECSDINKYLIEPCKLKPNDNGDLGIDDKFNNDLAKFKSSTVKNIIDKHVNAANKGFCIEKTKAYVNTMPKEEISEDIVNMYEYLVANNE
jgi:ABC-type cobalamin/Fe3+-siderophores transport system ATPase subunit